MGNLLPAGSLWSAAGRRDGLLASTGSGRQHPAPWARVSARFELCVMWAGTHLGGLPFLCAIKQPVVVQVIILCAHTKTIAVTLFGLSRGLHRILVERSILK